MRTKLSALLICALMLPAAAMAQVRQIPDIAKRGNIVHIQDTIVEIDGQRMRLSAGAQIRSRDNLFIVPTSLPPGAPVKYTLDGNGKFRDLSAEEKALTKEIPQASSTETLPVSWNCSLVSEGKPTMTSELRRIAGQTDRKRSTWRRYSSTV